ncbi:hypothetical protein FA13DRAFT_1427279 [Coprinellus micaceus]|uniref:Uncharacterized protein n=1 Tax=Coprinellus micaceus TaxID=71717 RepID=A0A4Y7TL99_COPMI|nr:hypothetical protein FA13DRAFT_1427279 [Coprinellus micaceus]
MCCGASNTDTAPKDGYHPNEDPAVSPYWATHAGPHRYIGIIMVVIMVFLAVGLWATFAKWPRQRVRRWLGLGGRGCECGEEGCKDEKCVDVESGKKRLKDLVLIPRLSGEKEGRGGEVKQGRSARVGGDNLLGVKEIQHSRSSATTIAGTVYDERKISVQGSTEASHSSSASPIATSAGTLVPSGPPAAIPTSPAPAYTLCRTRVRTPYVGSQSHQDNGRISRLGWLKRLGTPKARS